MASQSCPSSQQSSRSPPVLRGAAAAVAAALSAGGAAGQLEVTRQLQQLKEVLLNENPDASDQASARAASLRAGFASALRAELLERPLGRKLLEGPTRAPKVRVEVRQTAARFIQCEAFTMGRAAECDVQAAGDPTLSRLQLLVVSLPAGIVITDAWSGGGTRMVRRSGPQEVLPASVPQHRTAIFVAHGERVTLLIGAKTNVTLGPIVEDVQKASGSAVARVPTKSIIEAQASAAKAAVPGAKAPEPKAAAAPALASAVPPTTGAPSVAGHGGVCSKSINAMRSTLRHQQLDGLRDRLRGRAAAAVLPERMRRALEEHLTAPTEHSLQDVRDVLDGFGVPLAPDETCSSGTWTCASCKVAQKTRGWRCPFKHRFCRCCVLSKVAKDASPCCPNQACSYILGAADLEELRVPEGRRKAITTRQPSAISEQAAAVLRCSSQCGAAVKRAKVEERCTWQCGCGAPPVCTGCGSAPHRHGHCKQVRQLRKRWLQWSQGGGREAYRNLQKRSRRKACTQQRALREAIEIGSQQTPDSQDDQAVGATPAQAAKLARAKVAALGGSGVRHLLTVCSICGSGGRGILGPRFRCIQCEDYSVCQKCEPKLAAEHPSGHVFEIMFEDDLNWKRVESPFPRGVRARLRQNAEVSCADGSRKRLCSDGVLRGQKRGKYNLELSDGSGKMEVTVDQIQPLLTQKQAERLEAAGVLADDAQAA